MHALAKKHDAEMAICNLQKVDEHGVVTQKLTQIDFHQFPTARRVGKMIECGSVGSGNLGLNVPPVKHHAVIAQRHLLVATK